MILLTAAFVVHVVSAGLWTGATLYVAYAILPAARTERFGRGAFVEQLHRLLLINRWTGLALPATGAYMIWELYTPLWLLFDTQLGGTRDVRAVGRNEHADRGRRVARPLGLR